MALRLRRGTDAERLLITPVEGELIYTTDTKSVYVGDGTTVGGVLISGEIELGDLDDVDLSTPPTSGQVLEFDGTKFVPRFISGVVEGSNYRINVISADSTTIVDSDTGTFTGTFVGDGSGLTNLPIDSEGGVGIVEGSNYRINVVADDSTILVDTRNSTISGTFVGDGSEITNINFSNIDGVFIGDDPGARDILYYDGDNWVPGRIDFLYGDDSVVAFDASTTTFTGTFVGDGSALTGITLDSGINGLNDVFVPEEPAVNDVLTYDGDNWRAGRVETLYGNDSTVAFDANTTTFTGTFVGDGSGLTGVNQNLSLDDLTDVFTPVAPAIGDFLSYDGSNWTTGRIDFLLGDDSTVLFDASAATFTGNFVGDVVGDVTGNVLGNVTGNAAGNHSGTFTGNINATGTLDGDIQGSVFGDNSSLLVDGISGTHFGSFVGSLTTERITPSLNDIIIENADNVTTLEFKTTSATDLSSNTDNRAAFNFGRNDVNGSVIESIFAASRTSIYMIVDDGTETYAQTNTMLFDNQGRLGIGTYTPQAKLQVAGPMMPGVYADASARDTAIPSPVAGMMIYVTDVAKFQGNTDGTTSGWVNLN